MANNIEDKIVRTWRRCSFDDSSAHHAILEHIEWYIFVYGYSARSHSDRFNRFISTLPSMLNTCSSIERLTSDYKFIREWK